MKLFVCFLNVRNLKEMSSAINYVEKFLEHQPDTKFIILSGAGISTNAGIPDYRSNSRDLLNLFSKKMNRDEFIEHPLYCEFKEKCMNATPTLCHHLAEELNKRNCLKRVYTQNVDGLYQRTGLSQDKIVEFHGSIADDSIVRYGDDIPKEAILQLLDDFNISDPMIILVMGTSLQVYPFAAIPNLAPKRSVRILVNINTSSFLPKLSTLEYGFSHSIGSSPVTFSVQGARKRRVRSEIEWGYGNHTRKKKWRDFLVTEDTDNFSEELLKIVR